MWVTRSILGDALGLDTRLNTGRLQDLDVPTASISVVDYTLVGDSMKATVQYIGKKPPVELSAGDKWGG